MKCFLALIIFCSMLQLSIAQTDTLPLAPDFTITTTDGTVRHLYADYLTQGKAVVIEVFFTTCQDCLSMASLIEPFYQEWAGGSGPVEFIALSTRANDSNDDVRRYKAMLNHTYLGAGNDGGSMEAVKPYTNGTYGTFTGTPTFVVIAPNGKVTYNPKGNTNEATIDSIDQLLRHIGIEKPAVGFIHTGLVMLGDSSRVQNAGVRVRSTDMDYATSDSMGVFNFTAPLVARNSYRLQFSKESTVTYGVTTFDIVKVQRHVLGTELLTSPYQLIAADIDRSGAITILDIVQLRKLVLNLETTLPNNSSWIFLNADYTFLNPQDPFSEVYLGDATNFGYTANKKQLASFKVIAIKVGDVNFSAK